MAFFDKVGQAFTATGQSAVQKTKEFAEITKLNGRISENKNRINQLYMEIGEMYCKLHASDAETALAKLVAGVLEMQKQNDEWSDQIQVLRGMVKCPNCGEYVVANAPYCTACGHRLIPESAVICPVCKEVVSKGALFCERCGTRIIEENIQQPPQERSARKAVCQCGAELEEGSLFCSNCGRRVMLEEKQNVTPPIQYSNTTDSAEEVMAGDGATLNREGNTAEDYAEAASGNTKCDDVIGEEQMQGNEQSAVRRCPYCGAEQDADSVFCVSCGEKLE